MHYIQWNVADYASHTAHLTPIEDIAYRRMLDLYYLHEKPLARDPKAVARDIRMREHEDEVRAVLAEFFTKTAAGHVNKRADEEIERYRQKVEAAAAAGRTSAQRRSNDRSTTVQRPFNDRSTTVQRPFNGNPTDVQPTKNQEPRTSTKEPEMDGRMDGGSPCQEQKGAGASTPVPRTGLRAAGEVAANVLRAVRS